MLNTFMLMKTLTNIKNDVNQLNNLILYIDLFCILLPISTTKKNK